MRKPPTEIPYDWRQPEVSRFGWDDGFNPRAEPRYGRNSGSYHPILDLLARCFPRTFSDGTATWIALILLTLAGIAAVAVLGITAAGGIQ